MLRSLAWLPLATGLLVAAPNPGASPSPVGLTRQEGARFLMGTLARITVFAANETTAKKCVETGFQALERADSLFSTWRQDSEMARLNQGAAKAPVQVSKEMAWVLEAALVMARRSGGAFDPTVLPLVELWGFRDESSQPPPKPLAIQECLEAVGFCHVNFSARDRLVSFDHPRTRLDFGAIAKGATLEMAARAILRQGANGCLLDLGGGLLLAGDLPIQQIGIVNPLDERRPLSVVPLRQGAVATSGQYERHRSYEQQTWGHILDARTGRPCQQALSVTVIGPSALQADALATACFVAGADMGARLLEESADYEGLFLYETSAGEPRLVQTTGWPGHNNQISGGPTGAPER